MRSGCSRITTDIFWSESRGLQDVHGWSRDSYITCLSNDDNDLETTDSSSEKLKTECRDWADAIHTVGVMGPAACSIGAAVSHAQSGHLVWRRHQNGL